MVMTDTLRMTEVHGRLLSSDLPVEGVADGSSVYGDQDLRIFIWPCSTTHWVP